MQEGPVTGEVIAVSTIAVVGDVIAGVAVAEVLACIHVVAYFALLFA